MSDAHVTPTKQRQLAARLKGQGIADGELREKFVLGSGHGGQKVNKTSSCVYLKHLPTGIEIKCQRSRSREMNRYLARKELCDRLEERVLGERSRRRAEIEKIRRQKRRRTRRQKARMLALKRMHSEKKKLRAPVNPGREA